MKKRLGVLLLVLCLLVGTNFMTYRAATNYGLGLTNTQKNKLAKINFLENYVKKNFLYDVKEEDLIDGELKGVLAGLKDPYSEYLTAEDMNKMVEFTTGKFYGIGVVVAPGKDNLITVVSPIKGSPADKAGIKAGDKILKVDDKEYSAEQLSDATNGIKGEKGTKVKLTILSKGENRTKDVEVERDEVKMETVQHQMLDGFAYIGIISFDEDTAADFRKALDELMKQNPKGLILDLRGNGGGVIEGATGVCDALLPEGVIVSGKDREGKTVFEYKSDKQWNSIPLVLLINGGSASASEIVAGAIKDYGRGTLVGEKSFGKGIVQTVTQFPAGDGVKLTTSQYFTPKGKNIHKIGVEPDILVKEPEDAQGIGVEFLQTDTQLQKAIELLKNGQTKTMTVEK